MTGGWYSNGLLQKPRLLRGVDVNNMDYEKERDMTWTELFFDLIFVTATTRLGDRTCNSGVYYTTLIND